MSIASAIEAKRHPGLISASQETKEDLWLVLTESNRAQDENGWVHECGTDVLGLTVVVSIHDGPFPLSGFGTVERIEVPYCPRCEFEPNGRGSRVPGNYPVIEVAPRLTPEFLG